MATPTRWEGDLWGYGSSRWLSNGLWSAPTNRALNSYKPYKNLSWVMAIELMNTYSYLLSIPYRHWDSTDANQVDYTPLVIILDSSIGLFVPFAAVCSTSVQQSFDQEIGCLSIHGAEHIMSPIYPYTYLFTLYSFYNMLLIYGTFIS